MQVEGALGERREGKSPASVVFPLGSFARLSLVDLVFVISALD